MIDAESIRHSLRTRALGQKLYSFATIDSTNTFARTLGENDAPHGTLIVTEEQTSGRGRQGRRWESQTGKNLLFTVVLRTRFLQERALALPFVGALAAAEAAEQVAHCSVECKWPNDLLVGRKKFAGMLIEGVSGSDAVTSVIMGFGINVNQAAFSDEVKERAISLLQHTGKEVDRVQLLCRVLEELEDRLEQLRQFSPRILLDDWKRRTAMFGSRITISENGRRWAGTAVDVTPNGALVVEDENGRRREVFAGDVTLS